MNSSNNPRILIVEDERPIAENIIFALEAERFETKWIARGSEAFDALTAFDPNLIILDINLPDITGFDVCRAVRKICSIPILFLSARQDEVDRIVALELGGDDYMMKPFSLRELVARLRAILRRSDMRVENNTIPPKVKPLNIDEQRHRVEYFGEKLELSRYEYHILRALAARPGWVLSRDQLIDHSMGAISAPFDRTIDAHIKSIRAKMKKIKPDIEAIETQRGFGYALSEKL